MPTNPFRGGSSGGGGSAYFGWPGHFIYDDPLGLPTGNLDINGSRPLSIDSAWSNATGWSSVTLDSAGVVRVYCGPSKINFPRNTGVGGTIRNSQNSTTWNGGLVGTYNWSTVASMPQAISCTRTARNVAVTIAGSSSDGGASITSYQVQRAWSADGTSGWSAWEDTQNISSGAYTYSGLTPGRYYKFRTFANNARGSSQARESSVLFVPAGGKRKVSSAFQNTTIARRRQSASWIDLSVAKRKESGVMVDLS